MDWQPIDTAPKDGTAILIFGIGYDKNPFVSGWHCGRWADYKTFKHPIPTHWMPLPPNPLK